MLTVLIHLILCIGLAGVAGFVAGWLWRGIEVREAVRLQERNWQGMLAARDAKLHEVEAASKRTSATLSAKQADLDTLKAGYAESEAMFDQDIARKNTELAAAQGRVALLERQSAARELEARDREARLAALARKAEAAENDLRTLRVLLAERASRIDELAVQLAAAEARGTAGARIAALEAEIASLVDVLARLEEENRILAAKLPDTRGKA